MQQKKRYRQLRKSKRSPLLEMQEQPFKRLFFFAKTDSCEIQIKNRQQRRPGSKTSSCAGSDQKP
jgi:hypothetical protein